VSLKRKRAAVATMRLHVIDRTGSPAPISSNIGYEARSVAVPFGNCIEPSNVKAGGNACPIRFQCPGCGFYRPDPSYPPAIEEHINSLRADRETAQAMDVDDFVIRNLTEQIATFQQVIATMQSQLASLPADERTEIEEASAVLRKARATHGRTTLPLTVISRRTLWSNNPPHPPSTALPAERQPRSCAMPAVATATRSEPECCRSSRR
jgi:hypothetical protein